MKITKTFFLFLLFATVMIGSVSDAHAQCAASYTTSTSGFTATFTSTSTVPAGGSIQWYFGDGSPTGSGTTTNHTYANGGTYWTACYVYDSSQNFCDSVSSSVTISGGGGSGCAASFTAQAFLGGWTNFTNTSTGMGAGTVCTWSFGDGTSSTTTSQANPQHTYANPGAYVACLAISDTGGCSATYCDSVLVPGSQSCTAMFSATTSSLTAAFTNSSTGNPTTFSWSFGDGASSTSQNPTHTYTSTGAYTVCLTIGGSGCNDTYCDSVYVSGGGSSCAANFSSTSTALTAAFTDQSTGSPNSWGWSFGDGNSSTSQNPNHTYAAAGTYSVCLSIQNASSCQDSICKSITVTAGPSCMAAYYHYPDTTQQYTRVLVSTSTGNNLTYFWDFGDSSSSTQQFPSHTYQGPATYSVCLTITSTNPNCTSTYCDTIPVYFKKGAPYTINVIDPMATGIAKLQTRIESKVFPNPSEGIVNIIASSAKGETISANVYDLQGRTIAQLQGSSAGDETTKFAWDASGLVEGIYIARIKTGSNEVSHKIIIR